jgi:hypothetical protein
MGNRWSALAGWQKIMVVFLFPVWIFPILLLGLMLGLYCVLDLVADVVFG